MFESAQLIFLINEINEYPINRVGIRLFKIDKNWFDKRDDLFYYVKQQIDGNSIHTE